MTISTPEAVAVETQELHSSARAQVVRVISALNQLEVRVEQGEVGSKSEVSKVLGDIRDWLKLAHEMELRLEKQRSDYAGGRGQQALDLEEARSAIGCRLARLRRSGCSGCVSG